MKDYGIFYLKKRAWKEDRDFNVALNLRDALTYEVA